MFPAFHNVFTPVGVANLALNIVEVGVLIAFIRQRSRRDKRLDKMMDDLYAGSLKSEIDKTNKRN